MSAARKPQTSTALYATPLSVTTPTGWRVGWDTTALPATELDRLLDAINAAPDNAARVDSAYTEGRADGIADMRRAASFAAEEAVSAGRCDWDALHRLRDQAAREIAALITDNIARALDGIPATAAGVLREELDNALPAGVAWARWIAHALHPTVEAVVDTAVDVAEIAADVREAVENVYVD